MCNMRGLGECSVDECNIDGSERLYDRIVLSAAKMLTVGSGIHVIS